jgi:Phage integrase, N-terminal SAM-like domain
VSRPTAPGFLYPVPPSAPWILREASPPPPARPRRLDRVRDAIRTRHYSRPTEKAYVHWIRRFIFFHDKRHPAEMGPAEIAAFLSSLAVRDKVAASTQNQALSTLLFLYRDVLGVELPGLDDVVWAKRPQYLPVVLTREETRTVLQQLTGMPRIMALPTCWRTTTTSDRPGTPRPPRCQHHHDLHARPQPGPGRRPEPRRSDVPLVILPSPDVEPAAGAGPLAIDASQDIWARASHHIPQRHKNRGSSKNTAAPGRGLRPAARGAPPGYTELCESIA